MHLDVARKETTAWLPNISLPVGAGLPMDELWHYLVMLSLLALLVFGPRRGGRMPGPLSIAFGIVLLVGLAVAWGFALVWKAIVGPLPMVP